jgi:uroporphyrinogen-III synthase
MPTLEELQRRLQQKEETIRVLRAISSTIATTLDLNEVLQNIIALVRKTTRADACLLYLTDAQHAVLILRASQNKASRKKIGTVKLTFRQGITGWVARHAKTVALSSAAYHDERFERIPGLPEDQYEAFLSVPISYHHRVVGVMNIEYKKTHSFTDEEIAVAELIGQQVGGAIINAELLEETQTLKEILETRKMVDRAKANLIKRGLSEAQAHQFLHKKSMDTRKSLREVAEAVLLLSDL